MGMIATATKNSDTAYGVEQLIQNDKHFNLYVMCVCKLDRCRLAVWERGTLAVTLNEFYFKLVLKTVDRV